MSINITAHQKCVKKVNVNLLKDVDAERKRLLEERRINRLQQVREKSNELAKRVRRNVNEEYKRHINAKVQAISRASNDKQKPSTQPQTKKATPKKLPRVVPEEEESEEDENEVTLKGNHCRSNSKEKHRPRLEENDKNRPSVKEHVSNNRSSYRNSSSSANTSHKKNVTPVPEQISLSSTCSSSTSSMCCDSDSNCTNETCLTTTKPLVLEIISTPAPNIKIFEEKFAEPDTPEIQIIEKRLSPESKSVEVICSAKAKPHFQGVSELLKRKQTVVHEKPIAVVPENKSYDYSGVTTNKPKPVPSSAVQSKKDDMITFDYNNKYITSNLKKANTVQREPLNNIPDANFQAQQENREKFKEEQNRKAMNKKIEARGVLALQKEQITKEFNDLKTKLDIIAKQKSLCDDATVFASIRPIAQQEKKDKELKKFEELLRQPKVLTCPEYPDYKEFEKDVQARNIPKKTEINIANHIKPQDSSQESNSCCTILLDVVNKTNKKVTEDLHQNKYNEKQCQQLKKLLKKIDDIRRLLMHELSNCKPSSEKDMKCAVDSVVSVIRERNEILNEKKKSKNQSKENDDSDSSESVEVVVFKSPKKFRATKKQKIESESSETAEVEIKENRFKKPLLKDRINDYSSSTNYMSPPDRMQTRIDKICNQKEVDKLCKQKEVDKLCKQKDEAKMKIEENDFGNSELMPYIQRLLGMNRTSINALGLSSSTVTTPNSSTIAIESNRDPANNELETSNREQYINENYEFIERMRKEILNYSPKVEELSKRLTKNWEDSLKNISPERNNSTESQQPQIEEGSVSQEPQDNEVSRSPEANTTVDTAKIDRLSENVEQRIHELNEMISKVRMEKQKILKSTIPCTFEEEEREIRVEQRKSILKKNAPINLSRDSGLSSRPTSTQPLDGSPVPNPMLSTIIEIESPKNLSKEEIHSSGGEQEKSTELTIEGQKQLNTVIQTLKEANKFSQTDFVSFTTFLRDVEEKSTFNNLINSLKVGNSSLASYKEPKTDDSEVPPERNDGNNSDSFMNIVSELNRRNIYLDLSSSKDSSSASNRPTNNILIQSTQPSSEGTSNNTQNANAETDNHLNLREFLTRELEKRMNTSPNSCDTISSSLMKSLYGSIADKQKTSTPMYETSSSDKTINDLFSISTVTVNSK